MNVVKKMIKDNSQLQIINIHLKTGPFMQRIPGSTLKSAREVSTTTSQQGVRRDGLLTLPVAPPHHCLSHQFAAPETSADGCELDSVTGSSSPYTCHEQREDYRSIGRRDPDLVQTTNVRPMANPKSYSHSYCKKLIFCSLDVA